MEPHAGALHVRPGGAPHEVIGQHDMYIHMRVDVDVLNLYVYICVWMWMFDLAERPMRWVGGWAGG